MSASWRLANSLEVLRKQVNVQFPDRRKDSDGTKGDDAHAARVSDHNPKNGVVHALDLTHDPANGFDSYAFADYILSRQDSRLDYVISNHRIGNGPHGAHPGKWQKYSGVNPHDHHVHVSVVDGAAADDIRQWAIGFKTPEPVPGAKPVVHTVAPATLRVGATGELVKRLQTELGCTITGTYGARSETEFALRLYQVRNGLDPDGVCGPQTWKKLWPEGFKTV